jgi:hypothetical protein
MKDRIKRVYKQTIKKTFKNPEIKKFLLNHERRNILFESLEKEIKRGELTYPISSTSFDRIVKDMTIQFCRAALSVKEKEIISDNARSQWDKRTDNHLDILKKLDETDLANDETLTQEELERLREQKKNWKRL